VVDYENWKAKVRHRQAQGTKDESEESDGPINH